MSISEFAHKLAIQAKQADTNQAEYDANKHDVVADWVWKLDIPAHTSPIFSPTKPYNLQQILDKSGYYQKPVLCSV